MHVAVCVFVVVSILCLFTFSQTSLLTTSPIGTCISDRGVKLLRAGVCESLIISYGQLRYVHIQTNQVSCARGLLRGYSHDLYPDEKSVREVAIKAALIHRSTADESLSHNVFDNQRQRDNNEILSGPAIDEGAELTHAFHSGPRRRRVLQIDATLLKNKDAYIHIQKSVCNAARSSFFSFFFFGKKRDISSRGPASDSS